MGVLRGIGWHAREAGSNEGVHHLDVCMCVGEVVVVVCYVGEKDRLGGMERRTLLVYDIVVAVKADRALTAYYGMGRS